jgi:hypothetical protein
VLSLHCRRHCAPFCGSAGPSLPWECTGFLGALYGQSGGGAHCVYPFHALTFSLVSCFFHLLPHGHFDLLVSLLTVARRRCSGPCGCCLPPSRTPMDWCPGFIPASVAVFSLFVLPCPSEYCFFARCVVVACGAFHACTLCACRWPPRACPVRMLHPQLNSPSLGPGEAFFSFLCSVGR